MIATNDRLREHYSRASARRRYLGESPLIYNDNVNTFNATLQLEH